MNHLFNAVKIGGEFVYLEPQAKWNRHNTHSMYSIWGNKYDPAFNRDVTKDYLKYVR